MDDPVDFVMTWFAESWDLELLSYNLGPDPQGIVSQGSVSVLEDAKARMMSQDSTSWGDALQTHKARGSVGLAMGEQALLRFDEDDIRHMARAKAVCGQDVAQVQTAGSADIFVIEEVCRNVYYLMLHQNTTYPRCSMSFIFVLGQ